MGGGKAEFPLQAVSGALYCVDEVFVSTITPSKSADRTSKFCMFFLH